MDAYEVLLTRRSVRSYTDQKVSPEIVRKLLAAAMHAPSASNTQPWHFVAINRRLTLTNLAKVLPFGQMLPQAPLAIAVCGDPALARSEGYWVQDCANAALSILLAAHALGLGGVWLGVYPREERVSSVRRVLGLPESIIPLTVLSLGYPAEPPVQPTDRYKAERIHQNKW